MSLVLSFSFSRKSHQIIVVVASCLFYAGGTLRRALDSTRSLAPPLAILQKSPLSLFGHISETPASYRRQLLFASNPLFALKQTPQIVQLARAHVITPCCKCQVRARLEPRAQNPYPGAHLSVSSSSLPPPSLRIHSGIVVAPHLQGHVLTVQVPLRRATKRSCQRPPERSAAATRFTNWESVHPRSPPLGPQESCPSVRQTDRPSHLYQSQPITRLGLNRPVKP
jgi:hypothetical protein